MKQVVKSKSIFFVFFTLLISISMASGTPSIKFDTLSYSFNTVDFNQKHSYNFKFKNTGNADLIIKDLKSSCDCAAAKSSDKPVSPDGEGEILVTMSSGSTGGQKDESVFVYTNDPKQPTVELKLSAFVVSEISIVPMTVSLPELKFGKGTTLNVTLTNTKGEPLKIEGIHSELRYVLARMSPATYNQPNQAFVILTVQPNIPIGKFSGSIQFKTNNKVIPQVDLPVSGEVLGDVSLSPNRFFFGLVKKNVKTSRTITLTAPVNRTFSVTKVETNLKGLSLKLEKVTKGKEYKIIANLDTGKSDKQVSDKIIVHTNLPDQSVITIPVYWYIL